MVFTAGFCKRLHLDSSTYLSATFQSATLILSCAMLSLYGTYKMISRSREDSLMNLDLNVCKNQRRVCFIRGEEFQHVGRTIFIK